MRNDALNAYTRSGSSPPTKPPKRARRLRYSNTPPDILLENHGTIAFLRAQARLGASWLLDRLDPGVLRFGEGFVVEPRYVLDIVHGALAEGLRVGNAGVGVGAHAARVTGMITP